MFVGRRMTVIVICQRQSGSAAAFFIILRECTNWQVDGAFVKFPKATTSFVIPLCQTVRMEQLGSRWRGFNKI
jgi:hypothetical protein